MNYTQDTIKDLVGACFPLIYVTGQESENVIVKYITKQVASLDKFRCFEWSRTQGITSLDGEANPCNPQETMDANAALDEIIKMKTSGVFIMKHLHFEFKNGGNPHVIRKLQDFINSFFSEENKEAIGKVIIIVSPITVIPPELERGTFLVDYDLLGFDAVKEKLSGSVIKELEAKNKKKFSDEELNEIVRASQGLTDLEIDNGCYFSIMQKKNLDPTVLNNLKSQIVRKNGMIDCITDLENSENLGGFDRFKIWIEERKAGFTTEGQKFGLSSPKGVLLIGLQGSGKTMASKVIASMFNMPLYKIDLGKMFSSLVGQSEQKTRDVLKTLEAVAPCVVLFDEIEKGLAGLESSGRSDAGTTSRVIGTILQWLNDKKAPVFVVATSNNIRSMPPELLRAGRFDGIWFVSLPSPEERSKIFEIHLKKVNRDISKFDLKKIVKSSENYSGAEIEQAVKNGLYRSFNKKLPDLDTETLLESISEIIPLYVTAKEQLKSIYEWVGFEKNKNDGIRARFVSSYSVNKYEEDKKTIGFQSNRLNFVQQNSEDKK